MNIMFDVDGVLADFVLRFTQEAAAYVRVDPWSTTKQPTWEIPEEIIPKRVQRLLWAKIDASSTWWTRLEPLCDYRVFRRISGLVQVHKHDVVFCTNRCGLAVQQQTQLWLSDCGIQHPNVIVSKRKGDVARALDIDYSIDDKLENANCIHWIADARPCRSYLIDRLYNREGRAKNIRVVPTIEAFLDVLEVRDENL